MQGRLHLVKNRFFKNRPQM